MASGSENADASKRAAPHVSSPEKAKRQHVQKPTVDNSATHFQGMNFVMLVDQATAATEPLLWPMLSRMTRACPMLLLPQNQWAQHCGSNHISHLEAQAL